MNDKFVRWNLSRITTGSQVFDSVFGGGLPLSSITDVFGSFATGKTQFAFQNAVMTCMHFLDSKMQDGSNEVNRPVVVFVDCAGSFRPERIAEISSLRNANPDKVLGMISCAYVRSISEQLEVSERLLDEERFSKCRLIIVDDITINFATELDEPEEIFQRQFLLPTYIRKLAYIANRKGVSVLLTNSIRSRSDSGLSETTGEVIAQYALYRLHFKRADKNRSARFEQPILARGKECHFEIEPPGIVP